MLPQPISGLERLARNLWWCWDTEASALFESIDPVRWFACRRNPIAMLQDVEAARLEALAADSTFVHRVTDTLARLDAYLGADGWCKTGSPDVAEAGVAYLCMEFGLHDSLRIYSGGLGVLAGDHLKSASDLGVPLVAVGLLYRRGYFRQVIDDGQQLAAYPNSDWSRLAAVRVLDANGVQVQVEIPIGAVTGKALVWRVAVGRIPLLLLDMDHAGNQPAERALTHHLYGGDQDTRIKQEMIVGVGGIRALRKLGCRTGVVHMNEGHCAFAALELIRENMATGASFDESVAWVRQRLAFTTHTPVPAGHDRFPYELVERVLGPWRKAQELPQGAQIDLGRVAPGDWNESLCMTVLALRTAGRANGVSELHGQVSREMWKGMWPDRAVADVPIGHVTNGVHPLFWMAPEMRALFDAHLPGWREKTWDPAVWAGVEAIPDAELWSARRRVKQRMIDTIARRSGRHLDPDVLTIGFARRFAPYKRGDLLFRDVERLIRLLEAGPVQIIYSGKAHPADGDGKKIISNVVKWASSGRFHDRIAFVEEYDIEIGQALTSGCDVWLNNPRRPQEASGTSGQKVLLNGGLNLSILDGWWAEGWDGTNGWAISAENVHNKGVEDGTVADVAALDAADAESLYRLLENDVVPSWRDRPSGLPSGWIHRVKRSIETGIPAFNTHRMVRDYVLEMYAPLVKLQRES